MTNEDIVGYLCVCAAAHGLALNSPQAREWRPAAGVLEFMQRGAAAAAPSASSAVTCCTSLGPSAGRLSPPVLLALEPSSTQRVLRHALCCTVCKSGAIVFRTRLLILPGSCRERWRQHRITMTTTTTQWSSSVRTA